MGGMHVSLLLGCMFGVTLGALIHDVGMHAFLVLSGRRLPVRRARSRFESSLVALSVSLVHSFLLLMAFSLIS